MSDQKKKDTSVAKTTAAPVTAASVTAIIKSTKPIEVVDLEFVKNKYIQNYALCNKTNIANAELAYHRQSIQFRQLISESDKLKAVDSFTVYAAFVTCAVKGWSIDPQDSEVYLVPKDGKAKLWPQPSAYVRRLMQTKQIKHMEQAVIVFEGDEAGISPTTGKFYHLDKGLSKTMTKVYVIFILPDGSQKVVKYMKDDWEEWKAKSPQKTGDNWAGGENGQPKMGFLRSKAIKHAANDRSWAPGTTPPGAETFSDVTIEVDEDEVDVETVAMPENKGSAEQKPKVTNASHVEPPVKTEIEAAEYTEVQEEVAPVEKGEDDDYSFLENREGATGEGVAYEDEDDEN